MDIFEATLDYENWMGQQVRMVDHQLREKHAKMKADLFAFFRGTFYRWLQLRTSAIPQTLQTAPQILAIGDLHVVSFGTWRDLEGRLVWGVDDFDEAAPMPYTNDLVRLAASSKIARKVGALEIPLREACESILDGYRTTLKLGGSAVTLAEEEHILESLGIAELKSPEHFWRNLNRLPSSRRNCPAAARQAIEKSLPEAVSYKIVARAAGTGSLGQLRFVAIAEWKGGSIAREAKEMRPPASAWKSGKGAKNCYYNELMESAVRAHDPFQKVINGWLIRRLSPDSNPIAIADWPKKRDEFTLIRSMGWEAANVHLDTRHQVDKILDHLAR